MPPAASVDELLREVRFVQNTAPGSGLKA
jgi:hypothetical protein